jgi:hypothetical protein
MIAASSTKQRLLACGLLLAVALFVCAWLPKVDVIMSSGVVISRAPWTHISFMQHSGLLFYLSAPERP